jgi:hypothetical protein
MLTGFFIPFSTRCSITLICGFIVISRRLMASMTETGAVMVIIFFFMIKGFIWGYWFDLSD